MLNQHSGLQLLEVEIIQKALQGSLVSYRSHALAQTPLHLTDGHITQDASYLVPYLKPTTVKYRLTADFVQYTPTQRTSEASLISAGNSAVVFILTQLQFRSCINQKA